MSTSERQVAAEVRYRQLRQNALGTFVVPTLICWAVWALFGFGFPWPVFVTLGTGWRWAQLLTSHRDTVASIEHSMERRERRRLEQQARRERKRPWPGP